MKKKNLINYKLFQSRRKFNPLTLFNRKKDLSYEEFVGFLNSKMVDTPGIDYFERVKASFLESIKENKKPVEKPQENIEVVPIANEKSTARNKKRAKRNKKLEVQEAKKESISDVDLENKVIEDEKNNTE